MFVLDDSGTIPSFLKRPCFDEFRGVIRLSVGIQGSWTSSCVLIHVFLRAKLDLCFPQCTGCVWGRFLFCWNPRSGGLEYLFVWALVLCCVWPQWCRPCPQLPRESSLFSIFWVRLCLICGARVSRQCSVPCSPRGRLLTWPRPSLPVLTNWSFESSKLLPVTLRTQSHVQNILLWNFTFKNTVAHFSNQCSKTLDFPECEV